MKITFVAFEGKTFIVKRVEGPTQTEWGQFLTIITTEDMAGFGGDFVLRSCSRGLALIPRAELKLVREIDGEFHHEFLIIDAEVLYDCRNVR